MHNYGGGGGPSLYSYPAATAAANPYMQVKTNFSYSFLL